MANNALQFDGSVGQALTTALNAAVQNLTTMTFEFWLYRSGGGGSGYGRVFQSGQDERFKFENDNNTSGDGLVFITGHGGAVGRWSVAYPTNNTWFHYAITYNATSTSNDPVIIKDGVIASSVERQAPSGTLVSDNGDFCVGNYTEEDIYVAWQGRLACFRVWNVIRTEAQVAANKDYYLDPAEETGLVANWNFDEATGTTVADDANGSDLTIQSSGSLPVWATGPTLTAKNYTETPSGILLPKNTLSLLNVGI